MAQINEAALKADILLYLNTAATTFGQAAADAGPKVARTAMESFYGSYSPRMYIRTFDLRFNSYKRYYKNNGTRVYGGVKIGSDMGMKEYQYGKWSAAKVASTSWLEGSHGGVASSAPPYNLAETALKALMEPLAVQAIGVARSQGYAVIHF